MNAGMATDIAVAPPLAVGGLWSHFAPFEVGVRFLVTPSATVLMFHALQARNHAVAAVFVGVLALFYNTLLPMVSFSGDWQRAVVGASTPFMASLVWPNGRNRRTESNG